LVRYRVHLATDPHPETLGQAIRRILQNPSETFFRQWNWKSAVLSSLFRANIFFTANLTAGRKAAVAAAITELIFRLSTSGFYGALTQSFRRVQPAWVGAAAAAALLPVVSHSIELLVHWLRGTVNLKTSIAASICFTAISTVFNWYVMRRGALVVGEGEASIWSDLARMPMLLAEFFRAGFRLVYFHLVQLQGRQ
jgi:hypothetical protein